MRKIILFLTIVGLLTPSIYAQKLKYSKDVYLSVKEEKFAEALPKLRAFLTQKPNHVNANYWAGKIYYQKAVEQKSSIFADSCVYFYSLAIENITVLDLNPLNSSKYPDATGVEVIEKIESVKSFMLERTNAIKVIKEDWKKAEEMARLKAKMDVTDLNAKEELIELTEIEKEIEVLKEQYTHVRAKYVSFDSGGDLFYFNFDGEDGKEYSFSVFAENKLELTIISESSDSGEVINPEYEGVTFDIFYNTEERDLLGWGQMEPTEVVQKMILVP